MAAMLRSTLVALVALTLPGCSQEKDGEPRSSSSETGAPPDPGTSGGGVCDLAWTSMVGDVLGAKAFKTTIARKEDSVTTCQFSSQQPNAVLQVRIETGASAAAFEANKQGAGSEPVEEVPGLGDKAYRFSIAKGQSNNVVAMKGSSMVSLSLAGGEMAPLIELASKVIAALP
jgi:hypothetical protein